MQTHDLGDGRKAVVHDEVQVLHRVDTQGVVIGSTQLIEIWENNVLQHGGVVRRWIDWRTGSLIKMDSIPA